MELVVTILSILLLVLSAVLVISVIFQSGKQAGLPGSVSGAADTFFSKNGAKSLDAILAKATTVVAILFLITVIALNFAVNKTEAPATPEIPVEQNEISLGDVTVDQGDIIADEAPVDSDEVPAE